MIAINLKYQLRAGLFLIPLMILDILSIHIKHTTRNSSKEIPVGLIGLGKLATMLVSATAELITFIITIFFALIVAIGILIEDESFSVYFGVNPSMIIIAMLIAFLYIDVYSENFQTKFNKKCLNTFSISYQLKYYSFYLVELLSVKSLFFLFLGLSLAIHNYYTPFISIKQSFNLYVFTLFFYLIYNNIILILKLIWVSESKIKSHLIIYSIIPIVFGLAWISEPLFNLIENHLLSSILIIVPTLALINCLLFLAFKKIMISGYLLK